ncbi:MAG: ATP-binding cassette domain-containing protein [Dermatophilaceae bacterium]
MLPQFRIMQTSAILVNRILREQITGIRVVRAFVRERFEEDRFAQANQSLTGAALSVGRLRRPVLHRYAYPRQPARWSPSCGSARTDRRRRHAGGGPDGLYGLPHPDPHVRDDGDDDVDDDPARLGVRGAHRRRPRHRVLGHPPDGEHPEPSTPAQVTFENVEFRYPGAEHSILSGISFTAEPGRTTAIVGSTGAGKTTLIGLIPRLFDADGGRVVVGGQDVRDVEPARALGVLACARPYLSPTTAPASGGTASPTRPTTKPVEAPRSRRTSSSAPSTAGSRRTPPRADERSGGSANAGSSRVPSSGGPTSTSSTTFLSALDTATDARLRAALRPVTREATVIVVAQRVSTIIDADQIVVLEDGEIVGLGRHDEPARERLSDIPERSSCPSARRRR